MPVAAQQPVHLFEGPARVEFAGTPTQATSIRHFLQAMEATTAVAATPILGGLEVMLPARLNAHYNSLPYGNCGLLNGIGASLYSALTGARFRYRSTSFHVATEIELGGEFRVLDTYTGTRLVSTEPPELFTIEQLERDAAVWTPARTGDRFLFEKVAPVDPSGPPVLHTVPTWRLPVLDLKADDKLSIEPAAFDSLDLTEVPGIDLRALPIGTQKEVNHGRHVVHVARLTRPIAPGEKSFTFEVPFFITHASFRPDAWPDRPTDLFKIARDVAVLPQAPSWSLDLPRLLPALSWKRRQGRILEIGEELVIESGEDEYAHLTLQIDLQESPQADALAWLPLMYRTSTPSRHGDGRPVASLVPSAANWASMNLYARTSDTHYTDLLVPLAGQKSSTLDLYVPKGKALQINRAGERPNIAAVLSPRNPAMAVRLDLPEHILLSFKPGTRPSVQFQMLINPGFRPFATQQ